MTPQILVADTETTGQGDAAKIVELAWIEVDVALNEVSRAESLIDPECPISAGASGVHGITYDMVENSPTIDEYFGQVLHPPLAPEVILICHNVRFDRVRLEPVFNRYGTRIVGQMCSLRASRRYLPDAENHKLSTLMYQYGLDRGTSHRAMGDVQTLVSLLRLLVVASGKTLPVLIEEDAQPLLIEKMPFGKYKDTPIAKVPRDYCDWALGPKGLKEIDPDLKHTLQLRQQGRL